MIENSELPKLFVLLEAVVFAALSFVNKQIHWLVLYSLFAVNIF